MDDHGARIDSDIACLNTQALTATLHSTAGFNCIVWKMAGFVMRSQRVTTLNLVVKRHRDPCSMPRVRVYQRDYQRLRRSLGDMVPEAVFVATRIDGAPSVMVLASVVEPWFDLANPTHEEETRPLFERLKRAREQLAQFVRAARQWQREGRIIDLYGRDNLVLDRHLNVSYLDSFGVFFHADLLHAIDSIDEELESRMDISARRLDYVESLI